MVGTHPRDERNAGPVRSFVEQGWNEVMNFGRDATWATLHGDIGFGDGFLYFRNPNF
jgi:hypothetical protein